jgi:hypothetical protein
MIKKIIFFTISILSIFISFNTYANSLNLLINNQSSKGIKLEYVNSNYADKFESVLISSNKKAKKQLDFSDKYILSLNIFDENNIYITNIQIVNNHKYSNAYKNRISGNGPLTTFGCAWNNRNRVKINDIEGTVHFAWLTFSKQYKGNINIEIIDPPLVATNTIAECPAEFTLFAIPKNNQLKDIKLNTLFSTEYKLDKHLANLSNWNVKLEQKLLPVVYQNKKIQSRWVDLIIHNYSINTYLLYGLISKPENDHITFSYKQPYNKNNVVFYPPLAQLRGPGFKFSVTTEQDKPSKLTPDKNVAESKKDKYYLAIGKRIDSSSNIMEYMSVEIKTGIKLGSSMGSGININAYSEHAYQTGFYPVNVSFYIKLADESKVKDLIRIPLDKNGLKAFSLLPMENIKLKLVSQSSNSDKSLCNRSGIKYEISGVSPTTGETYRYRLILISPALLAGNTPGIYSPNASISSDSKIGNFIR